MVAPVGVIALLDYVWRPLTKRQMRQGARNLAIIIFEVLVLWWMGINEAFQPDPYYDY